MFSFFLKTFDNPPPRPLKWDHIDVYPEFSIWNYHVSSDRDVPGFTILENVDKRGFKCTVREFVPDGEIIPSVNLSVTTAPVYEKDQLYVINDVDLKSLKTIRQSIRSDNSGRLKINLNGSAHEIGINKIKDRPNVCIAEIQIENMAWARPGKEVAVSIKLLNKGLSGGKNVRAILSATKSGVNIEQGESRFGSIAVNEIQVCLIPFTIRVQADSIEIEKFKLTIQDEKHNEWNEFFEIPFKRDLPEIKNFEIADGKIFTVAKGGNNIETILLGNGNGDGVVNPGESIVILVKDQDKYWRTQLSFSDKYVNPFGVNIRKSDDWSDFDWVGASAKYSTPLLSSNCPQNHRIEFFAEYWLPDHPLHIIKQGVIRIEVKGNDKTAPKIGRVLMQGDNTLQVRIYDGSKIHYVKARLILKDDPAKSFEIELKDDGISEDRVEGDNVFSKKIPEQKFGFYRVVIEAMDSFGNKIIEEAPDQFVLH
jgi:hypothetical protein